MYLYSLNIRWRLLYLIYTHKNITIQELKKDFIEPEQNDLPKQINGLKMEGIIIENNGQFSIKQTQTDVFLRILELLKGKEIYTKTFIRNKLKHRQLKQVLYELVQSGIVYEYRNEISRTCYLLPSDRKDELIQQITNELKEKLACSEDIGDKSHLSMINNDFSIIRAGEDIQDFKIKNEDEMKVLTILLNDIKSNISRRIGRNLDYLMLNVFNGDEKKASKTILNLIDKGIIKCSRRKSYFLNDNTVCQTEKAIKIFEEKMKKN